MKTFLRAFALLFCVASFAQTTVKGTVSDDSGMPLAGANIIVTGTSSGAMTDFDGNFTLNTSENPPFTIQVSSVGFETLSQEVSKNNQTLSISLNEGSALDEVVISASRTPERIFESPVTVERFGLKEIKNKLKNNRNTKALFNTPVFTRNIEKAYSLMYERYLINLPFAASSSLFRSSGEIFSMIFPSDNIFDIFMCSTPDFSSLLRLIAAIANDAASSIDSPSL